MFRHLYTVLFKLKLGKKLQLKQDPAIWQMLPAAKAALEKKSIQVGYYLFGDQWLGTGY